MNMVWHFTLLVLDTFYINIYLALDERLGQAEHGEEENREDDLDAGAAAEDAAGLEREVLAHQREELRGGPVREEGTIGGQRGHRRPSIRPGCLRWKRNIS